MQRLETEFKSSGLVSSALTLRHLVAQWDFHLHWAPSLPCSSVCRKSPNTSQEARHLGLTPEECLTGRRDSVSDSWVGVEEDIVSLTKKNPLSLWICQDLSGHRRFMTQDTRKKITSLGLNIVNGMQTLYVEPHREGVKLLPQETKPAPG